MEQTMEQFHCDCDYLTGDDVDGIRYDYCYECYRYDICKKSYEEAVH